jgi:hypothetical protein
MQAVCFRFTEEYRRMPDVEELLAYYERAQDAGPATPARRKRARDAIRYRAMTFDYAAAPQAGYESSKDSLLDAVRTHCHDRPGGRRHTLTDEDLAIGLYVVTRASFSLHDDPALQWTVGHSAVIGMFDALRADGATQRRCPDRNKSGAILRALERAELIECLDRRYKPAGKRGICRKWTVGPAHPRYAAFVRFSETVRVVYIGSGGPSISVAPRPMANKGEL